MEGLPESKKVGMEADDEDRLMRLGKLFQEKSAEEFRMNELVGELRALERMEHTPDNEGKAMDIIHKKELCAEEMKRIREETLKIEGELSSPEAKEKWELLQKQIKEL